MPTSLRESSPTSPAPVRAVAQAISGWVDRLGPVWVEGQVAQLSRRQGSGTVFLTLRDSLADMSVTVTCQRAVLAALNPPLVEGASVVVHAKPSYYAPRGTLSLVAREIRMVGLGELLARLERRRQLLAAEGLFARELKRTLPFLPGVVGLVTAPGSAAERDVLENARRRWAGVRFQVAPASVQGVNAVREIVEALGWLERDPAVDVVVVARGGGSVEDLLPFSDETLVRTVGAMRTPVVSAIGHESDTPLLDLVADVRASTPTDAAKIVVPDVADELRRLHDVRERGRALVIGRLRQEMQHLVAIRSRPVLADPLGRLDGLGDDVAGLRDRARRCLGHQVDRAHDDMAHHLARVRALSPLQTLRRGYAVLVDEQGQVVVDAGTVQPGQQVTARLARGRLLASVDSVEPGGFEEPDENAVAGATGTEDE